MQWCHLVFSFSTDPISPEFPEESHRIVAYGASETTISEEIWFISSIRVERIGSRPILNQTIIPRSLCLTTLKKKEIKKLLKFSIDTIASFLKV